MSHPHGVQPSCSQDLYSGPDVRSEGLGLLHVLSDELLIEILHQLTARDLAKLAVCSRACYAYCQHEDIWKALLLQEEVEKFKWKGTWQRSHIAAHHPKHAPPPAGKRRIQARGLFSDLLYQPWLCANVEIAPEWLEVDNIDRRSGLSLEQFRQEYELPNKPVVLTDVVTQWPAHKRWSNAYLRKAFAGGNVIVGNAPMAIDTFLAYQADTSDEMPLYLFDKTFCDTAPQLAQEYSVPELFAEDLFSLLGPSRPDHKWLIMGPARSGSSFHVDPNSTSAWNALLRGRKKWVMFPPSVVPPGVHPSEDGAEVATPLSIVEWFINFYDETREGKVRPVEAVVEAGELIFVPRGWWHLALNLEESLAITHNYVSAANLGHVLAFLASRSAALVSGCALGDRSSLHDRFMEALQRERPELLEQLEQQRAAKRRKIEEGAKLSALFRDSAPAAAAAADGKQQEGSSSQSEAGAAAAGGGFTFGFSFGGK